MKPGARRFASPALLRGSTGDVATRLSLAGIRGVGVKSASLQLGQDLPTGPTETGREQTMMLTRSVRRSWRRWVGSNADCAYYERTYIKLSTNSGLL
jgi:hypothetical protein